MNTKNETIVAFDYSAITLVAHIEISCRYTKIDPQKAKHST